MSDFGKYVELINTTIDFERDGHDICIKPSFDEELQGALWARSRAALI